eukprot:g47357.t1
MTLDLFDNQDPISVLNTLNDLVSTAFYGNEFRRLITLAEEVSPYLCSKGFSLYSKAVPLGPSLSCQWKHLPSIHSIQVFQYY